MLVVHRPSAPLSSHVDSIWFVRREALPHRRERSLPTGRADIVIPLLQESIVRFERVDASEPVELRGAVVGGVHDRFAVRGTGGPSSVIGVHFKPGGAAAFFGGALPELRNRTVLLEAAWGAAVRDLRERLQAAPRVADKIRLLEAALLSRLADAGPADLMVARALQLLERDPASARIDAIQRASGCAPTTFIRRFELAVGLTPKRFARVARFRALLPRIAMTGARDWAGLAADGGYSDQSHLIHEFGRLAGVTPSAYRPVQADQPTHVPIADAPAEPAADPAADRRTRKNLQDGGRVAR